MNATIATQAAADLAGRRGVAFGPVSRIEAHGKATTLLDEQNRVQPVRLHTVEFRGFRKFIEGRPYRLVTGVQVDPATADLHCGIGLRKVHVAGAHACPASTSSCASERPETSVVSSLTSR